MQSAETPREAFRNDWPIYAVAITGTLLSIIGCLTLWRRELEVAQARFEAAAGNRAAAVRREIDADITMLLSLRSWRAESLEHLSEVIANALAERSSSRPSSGAAFVWFPSPESNAKSGAASRSVLVTGDWREFHSMDLDPWTHPLIAGAVRASCTSGRLAATAPIRLKPSVPAEVWMVAAMPGAAVGGGKGCPGFVAAVERVDLLTERALHHLVPAGVDVEISDATEAGSPVSMYLHRSRLNSQEPQPGRAEKAWKMAAHAQIVRVGGRDWLIANRPRRPLTSGYWQPWLALTAGLGMTALAAVAVGLALFQARHVKRIVRLRTAELLRAHEELARAHEKIVESDRVKSEFLANISHEIRTPLSGVVGMIDLTLDEPEESARREQIHAVRDSAQTLLVLVNQLLDFSKVESSGLTVEPAWFDLFATVDGSIRTLAIAAGKKGLTLKFTWHASLPRKAYGDALRLQQVLVNLIGNAIKFTDAGEIEVQVEPGPEGVRIRVRDTGIGIPAHMVQKIFEPFRQADGSAKRAHGGAGLGLSIAARLIGLMHGSIAVDSVEGAGSTFTVVLPQPDSWCVETHAGDANGPLHQQVITAAEPARAQLTKPGGAFTLLPPAALSRREGCNILLVEDNLINQRLALRLLQRGGHRVTLSEDGTQAVAVCRRARFDLILMDIQMPGMDGLEATRRIKSDPAGANRATPIVALSAHASRHDARECLSAGMCDLVTKPFTAEELERAIRRFTAEPGPALTALGS